MAEPGLRAREDERTGGVAAGVEALAAAARALGADGGVEEPVAALVEAVARATRADVAVARALDSSGLLTTHAVSGRSPADAAELEGSRLAADDVPPTEISDVSRLPESLRRTAERLDAGAVLALPLLVAGRVVGTLELLRRGPDFTAAERSLGRLAAAQLGLALRLADGAQTAENGAADKLLRAVGDALAAGSDETRTADQVALFAAEATGAGACLVWLAGDDGPTLVASHGRPPPANEAAEDVARALAARRPLTLTDDGAVVTVQLGEPPIGALQLFFAPGEAPPEPLLESMGMFGARAAHALRAGERARKQAAELEQTRALLAAVAQAIAQLSLAHTLETSIEHVSDLLGTDRLAVYLLEGEDDRLLAAAGRGLAGPHVRVAERLLELVRTGGRTQPLVMLDTGRDPRFAAVREASEEAGIGAAIAVPLLAQDEVIGVLAAYPEPGREIAPEAASLVEALAAQLAIAVQNARLHERLKQREREREQALQSERSAARRLRALHDISGSFARSMSLEATLDAVVRTVTELLDLDAVGMRMPDGRAESLVLRELHVRDERMTEPVAAVLGRPQPFRPALRRLFAGGRPILLDPRTAERLGGAYALLAPFLEKGTTAAIIPVSTQAEVLGTLTLVSLDPARPIEQDDVDLALSVAGHAALALENARLYQQQKQFTDAMQQSLLPETGPDVEGLEIGAVYESSARVDIGGDVYDFLALDDGRFAVVLGDVTGHGVDAAADMAMAKFVFRSLAREHPDPADFLAAANEVVVGEIAASKFITMLYLTIDATTGGLGCASAGHPAPLIVSADGGVTPLPATGVALGIEGGQTYDEVTAELEPGAAVVLYTDGIIEARHGGDLYGHERLEGVLASNAGAGAEQLAQAVVADARAFSGGELSDDGAVVVVKRAV